MLENENYPRSLGLDHPSVQEVIQIALEFTKEHKLINPEALYNRAKRQLQIPRKGLKKIIQMLFIKKYLVKDSRFTQTTILENKTRYHIFGLVNSYIGVHFSLLKTKVSQIRGNEIGVGHLIWHLEKLLNFNLIKKLNIKNCTVFIPIAISDEEGLLYYLLRDDFNRLIVSFLLEHDFFRKIDLYKELEIKREKIYYRINLLLEFEILALLAKDEKIISINSEKRDLIKGVISNILNGKRFEDTEIVKEELLQFPKNSQIQAPKLYND